MQGRFQRKIITKHNIQEIHIHSCHNRLLGEIKVILGLLLNISHSSRIGLEPILLCVRMLHFTRVTILVWKQVRNNHEILILIELWIKTKQWHREYEKYQFCTESRDRCFIKKLFFKISQYSQENNCVGISYSIKMQTFRPTTLLKGDSNTGIFWTIFRKKF